MNSSSSDEEIHIPQINLRERAHGASPFVGGFRRGSRGFRPGGWRGRTDRPGGFRSDISDESLDPGSSRGRGDRGRRGRGRDRFQRSDRARGNDYSSGDRHSAADGPNKRGRGGKDGSRGRGRGGSRSAHVHRMEFSDLVDLAKSPPSEVVNKIQDDLKGFQESLNSCNKVPEKVKERYIAAIISLLLKICQSSDEKANMIIAEFLSDRCSEFHVLLKHYVSETLLSQTNTHNMVSQLLLLFKQLLTRMPLSAWHILPINDFHEVVMTTSVDYNEHFMVTDLKALYTEAKQRHMEKKKSSEIHFEWDNSLYRTIPIVPTMDEICSSDPPRLRSNIINGAYTDWEHYYDVQFRLLREDFVAPLRRGVTLYLSQERTGRLTDINVYKDVYILKPEFTENGICYKVQFDVSRFRQRKSWAHSKRLIFGSLLCFSPKNNQFRETVYFATVVERKPEDLVKGYFYVQFENSQEIFQHIHKTCFVVIESRAYFEAIRHILVSLQKAETGTMPFKRYLIDNNPRPVNRPSYLQNGTYYDITWLYPESKQKSHLSLEIDITDEHSWPTEDQLELDASQINAIRMALTQEISVIQGPPGTGKTYIGYKIVQTLLQNRDIWDPTHSSPILVMCYTNHALDQFLQGIIHQKIYLEDNTDEILLHYPYDMHSKVERVPDVVRIGGRSKSEEIQKHSLWNARGNTVPYYKLRNLRELKDDITTEALKIPLHSNANVMYDVVNEYMVGREGMDLLRDVINPSHFYELSLLGEEFDDIGLSLELWLGFWTLPTETAHQFSISSSIPPDTEHEYTSAPDDQSACDDDDVMLENEEENIDIIGEAEIEESNRQLDDVGFKRLKLEDKHVSIKEDDILSQHIKQEDKDHSQFKIEKKDSREIKKILQAIRYIDPLEEDEEIEIADVRNLPMISKYRLFRLWVVKLQRMLTDVTQRKLISLEEKCRAYKEAQMEVDRIALEKADVIGMTTTGAAKYQHILHLVKPKIVIVEEAAEVLESHIVSALNAGTEHLILIGDHKQLRPKPNEYELAKKHHLEISLFERLLLNNLPHATLLIQHRMRPQISSLVCPFIYDELIDHETVTTYENIRSCDKNMFFFNHKHPETEIEHLLSHSNVGEAKLVVSLCRHLLKQGYKPSQITVLTAYTGQLLCVRDMMPKKNFEGVQVVNIDNFQGEENDIILLSLVRNNELKKVGFLKEENRVCVALSRARMGFYCFGNFDMLRAVVPIWDRILSYIESEGCFGSSFPIHCHNHPQYKISIEKAEDFIIHFPDGGCNIPCIYRLNCGHHCRRRCHVNDPNHEQYCCKEPCDKLCHRDLHPCPLRCSDACKRCTYLISQVMPSCGHIQDMECYKNPAEEQCHNPCSKKCPNGHICHKKCSEYCGNCIVLVDKIIPRCKHIVQMYCFLDPSIAICYEKCQKIYEGCNHKCPKKCFEDCSVSCEKQIEKVLPCSHIDVIPCSMDPALAKCTKPCQRKRECGHPCKGVCGESCSSYKCSEPVKLTLPCGHISTITCHNCSTENVYECNKPCEKILSCGHPCKRTCSSPCTTQCTQRVSFTCCKGHHTYKVRCFEAKNADLVCDKKCVEKLPCGHACTNKCGEECSSCAQSVDKHCPCGHKHKFKCGEYGVCSCKKKCPIILQCGHKCSGDCGECYTKRMHPPCMHQVQVNRFCGHFGSAPCIGLFDQCQQSCRLSVCPHNKTPCDHKCYEPCHAAQCEEKCIVECSHSKCTQICSEVCSVPSCTKPCTKLLDKCHHSCSTVCGEECISECCPKCSGKKFSEKVKGLGKKANITTEAIIKLNCGHIYSVNYLNQRFTPKGDQDTLICPLLCPACSKPFVLPYYWQMTQERAKDIKQVKRQLPTNPVTYSPDRHRLAFRKVTLDAETACALKLFSNAMELKSQLNITTFIENMLKQTKCKLTMQIVTDIESELFRLSLLTLAKHVPETTLSKQPLHSLLQQMDEDHNLRLTYEMYEEYLPAIRSNSVYEVVPVSLPKITKGQWYKCRHAGHIYFVPAKYGANCPECTECHSK
ncbi:PREDICTED: NFX1-type zinc finger-containing protein 1-like [Amphimedon queenslandica]|uniref:NF-X1-type domain-containing protein n=1 Tax=Amphimedon queenslandica TaxID=400682 RepID=A0A1X7UL49_AMPQE|nr:PREDICTED: NFX1-type zinc finger-containing protein 1-like [Amphimedon queenslandica]|eukprot:XP_011404801.1 PREDICTED: NFX1-type zinc finger-containing protein 1-like [Amphimedon queenslandica]